MLTALTKHFWFSLVTRLVLIIGLGVLTLFLLHLPAYAQLNQPVLVSPPNNHPSRIVLPPNLAWNPVVDPIKNPQVVYDLYGCIGSGCSATTYIGTASAGSCTSALCTFAFTDAQPDTTYGWMVIAFDNESGFSSVPSATWYFTTENSPSLVIAAAPVSLNIDQGQSAAYRITATGVNGVNPGTVSFGQVGCPSGAKCSFSPTTCTIATVNGNCSVDFLIEDTLTVTGGLYSLQLTGRHSSGLSKSTNITVNITEIPDLIISAGSWPTSVSVGQNLSFSFTTQNVGGQNAIGFDDALLVNGSEVNRFSDNTLAPGGALTNTLTWSPTVCGSYTISVSTDVDDFVTESVETNNTSPTPAHTLDVICPEPDLVVTGLTPPATMCVGQAASIGVSTRNQGGLAANASQTRISLGGASCNAAVSALAPTQVVTGACEITPTSAGNLTLSGQADILGTITESDETNNTFTISATVLPAIGAVALPTFSAVSDIQLTVNWSDVANESGYRIYRNTRSDFVSAVNVSGDLPANTSSWTDKSVAELTTYYYWVEAFGSCNVQRSPVATVTTLAAPAPDLLITALSASNPICVGQTSNITVTTRNQGTADAPASNTLVDMAGGGCSISVGALTVNQQSVLSCNITPVTTAASLSAVADSSNVVAESDESNNSNSVSVSVSQSPGAVTNLSSSGSSQTTISWSWSPVSGVSSYNYRLQGDSVWQSTAVTGATLSGLTCGTAYSIEVQANNICGGGAITSATASTNPCSNISLSISPTEQTIAQGDTTTYTVTANSSNAVVADTINFVVSGCPSGGTTCAFTPSTCSVPAGNGSCSVTLNIGNTGTTAEGVYTLAVDATASSSGVVGSAQAALEVVIPVDVLVGDLNCDNVVDIKDLGIILSTSWWGAYSGGYAHPSCTSGGGGGNIPPPPAS